MENQGFDTMSIDDASGHTTLATTLDCYEGAIASLAAEIRAGLKNTSSKGRAAYALLLLSPFGHRESYGKRRFVRIKEELNGRYDLEKSPSVRTLQQLRQVAARLSPTELEELSSFSWAWVVSVSRITSRGQRQSLLARARAQNWNVRRVDREVRRLQSADEGTALLGSELQTQ